MQKDNWDYCRSKMVELEEIKNIRDSFKSVEIDLELVNQVKTFKHAIADSKKPILATEGIYNCTGILAYDLSKDYAFLAHSFGNGSWGPGCTMFPTQIYDKNYNRVQRGIIPGSSIHVIEMLGTLSKKELYQLKFIIIIGSSPNMLLVNSMINTIMYIRGIRISIESIKLMKPFIEGIHTQNDVNLGKDIDYRELWKNFIDKNITYNEITNETHSYDKNRGASFAFDVRDGKMYTYNSDTNQYYTYDKDLSVAINMR